MANPIGTVRLSVNLAKDVADALKGLCAKHSVNLTEGTRRCIALWKLLDDEQAKGNRVVIIEGDGEHATQRELVML